MNSIPNLAWSLHERALAHPGKTAIVTAGQQLSYAALAASAGRVATWLRRTGLPANSRVGVLAARGPTAYAGILGAAWAGAAHVPLGPGQPDARLAQMLERAGLAALVVDDHSRARAARLIDARTTPLLAAESDAELESFDSIDAPAPIAPDALAYLMFTSGTTGVPKAVAVTAGNVSAFLRVVAERYQLGEDDRVSQFFELTFDLSVFDLFAGLGAGASLHVVPAAQRMAPVAFAREQRLSVWFSVPSTLADALRLKTLQPGVLPALRLSLFCGEPLPVACLEAWRAAAPHSRVENLYGPTEATVACLVERCDASMAVTAERAVVAIGRPFPGMQAAIHDAESGFLPPGEVGELVLAGAQVSAGYWQDDELTGARFSVLEHPTHGRQRWYRTGDLARQAADGRFHHLGRSDHQVKLRGHRVELEEIEAHLRDAAGTASVAAVAWPIQNGSALGIVAFLGAAPRTIPEVRERLAARLPAYMVPRRIVELEALPLASSGKLDRRALIELLEDHSPDAASGP